jgi:hypothetical protein
MTHATWAARRFGFGAFDHRDQLGVEGVLEVRDAVLEAQGELQRLLVAGLQLGDAVILRGLLAGRRQHGHGGADAVLAEHELIDGVGRPRCC